MKALLRLLGVLLSLAGMAALGMAAVVALLGYDLQGVAHALLERTPAELVRHAQRRLEGHPRLQALTTPSLSALQQWLERPVPPGELPTLGKGQQQQSLGEQRYGAAGWPLPTAPGEPGAADANAIPLRSASDIAAALAQARAGQRLVIAPGRYRFGQALHTRAAGTVRAPIVVTAQRPGEVILEFDSIQGIVVAQPYWVFENLTLRGVCRRQGDCEHAFHVVGGARATVIRNNRLEDFNAHLKVNGENGAWPDHGLLQYTTLLNAAPRDTTSSVTPVDIVGASGWVVADNHIGSFVKAQGNQVSFGVFMKGAGQQGRIERNLIICTSDRISQPGTRVGLSFGGGGTAPAYCRDGRCIAEHEGGMAVNNVIAHCNDFGIDVFRASATVAHNTLINTAGIDARDMPARAVSYGNLLDGRLRERQGGTLQTQADEVARLDGWFVAPDALALQPVHQEASIAVRYADTDFCGRPAPARGGPGALLAPLGRCPQH